MSCRRIRALLTASLLAGGALVVTSTPASAAGKCTTSTANAGHTAVGKCTGYLNTGTFRVRGNACITRCVPIYGNWAYLSGGTSRASAGSGYALNLWIEYGPNSG